MFKYFFSLFLLASICANAQKNDTTKYYKSYDYGMWSHRAKFDSIVVLPNGTIINRSFVFPSGAAIDTSSLSNRILTKVNISDTATMLSNYRHWLYSYLKAADITGKVNASDTATMLGHYYNSIGYGLSKTGQSIKLDTATAFPALRATIHSTPAGNYGNIQINRNGVLTTPSADSLTYVGALGLRSQGIVAGVDNTASIGAYMGNSLVGLGDVGLYDYGSDVEIATYDAITGKYYYGNRNFIIDGTTGKDTLTGTLTITDSLKAGTIKRIGGTSSQFLKADGSIDASTYATTANLALKVNIADTASMLSTYLRSNVGAATYATIANDNLKVKYTDTATMLSPYLRANLAAATYGTISNLALKVNISDTASMLSTYARTNVVNAGLALKVNISDTASMLSPYLRSNVVAATYLPLVGGTLTGNLLFSADNTKDIGATGATRPRTGYFGTSIIAPLDSITGNAIANSSPIHGNGTWFTGGSTTTTKPYLLIEPTGTTSTAWSTNGTGLGVNAATGFTGKLQDWQLNGVSKMDLGYNGALTVPTLYTSSGQVTFASTGNTISNFSGGVTGLVVFSNGSTARTLDLKAGSGTVDIQQWQNSSGTALNVVKYDGSVGIGTTSPTTKLQVNSGTALKVFSLGSSATGSYVEKAFIDSSGGFTHVTDSITGNAIANSSPIHGNGTWFTGGSTTTTKPYLLIEPTGTTSTAWSTNGTGLGVNAATGFTGNLIDAQLNGVSKMSLTSVGGLTVASNVAATGGINTSIVDRITANTGIQFRADPNTTAYAFKFTTTGGATTITTGNLNWFNIKEDFSPTSGTATFNNLLIDPNINQTGGASGITRGVYINPTLTATADYRALEISNGRTVLANNNSLKTLSIGSNATGSYVEKAYIDSSGNASIKGFSTGYVAKTANYTATISDHTIEATSGTFTITLPTAVGATGQEYVITNSGTGVVTLGTTSSQTFINVTATPTTLTLAQFATVKVQSNGANWLRITSL